MKRLLFLTILFLFFFSAKNVFAATEFISVVDTGGAGDYSSLSLWEAAIDSDLTLASNKVFAGTKTGSIADGASVTGSISLATGTVYHSTATQIYIAVLTGTFQSAEQIQVDGSNYFTTTDAGDSVIAIAKCRATTGAADTTAVTINDWTTSAANYIKIWTDPSENYRHQGKWDEGKYTYSVNGIFGVLESYTKIEGLQLKIAGNGFYVYPAADAVRISGSIVKPYTGTPEYGIRFDGLGSATGYANNNIIHGFNRGIARYYDGVGLLLYVYNNTVYGGVTAGIADRQGSSLVAKNNIAYNNITDYSGTFSASSTNNLSKDATAPPYNTYYTNASVIFSDEANQDFHLDSADTGARNQGIILYDAGDDANLNFTTDIDNNARLDSAGTWDIGADEAITKVYRSVGPSATTAIATGGTYGNVEIKPAYVSGSTTNIADYVATFWSDLPTNVGVGDALQYDDDDDGDIDASDSIVFITKRIDAAHFAVRSASGGTPSATLAPDSDWSVFRAYISLFNAEAGTTENTGIDSDLRNFDTWSNGKDIATGQEQWNISCYANSTTADTVATTINDWTTSVDSFIKIYTPTRSDEVGTSQRHLGVLDTSKYRIAVTSGRALLLQDPHINIEGIQIDSSGSDNDGIRIYNVATVGAVFQLSNLIIKGNAISASDGIGIDSQTQSSTIKIWNSIIYDFTNSAYGINISSGSQTAYIYNVSLLGNYTGIVLPASDTSIVKNVIANHLTGGLAFNVSGSFNGSLTYSASDDTTADDKEATGNRISQVFTFADETNDDFHLGVG
ncbi:TPA: hypothetical protein DCL22_01990, partial [Candidatus Moranbacteria bacterium]|nr:hypothetical protein [Candidatus Moranbacteria bacterium]